MVGPRRAYSTHEATWGPAFPRPEGGPIIPPSCASARSAFVQRPFPGAGAGEGPAQTIHPNGLWPPSLLSTQGYKSWWAEKERCKQQVIVFLTRGLRKSLWWFWVISPRAFCAARNKLHRPSPVAPPASPLQEGEHTSGTHRWPWRWPASPCFPAPPAAGPEQAPPELPASELIAPASVGPARRQVWPGSFSSRVAQLS